MSETNAIFIATYIDVQLPSTARGVELVSQYQQATRAQDGNLRSEIMQEIARPNRFVAIEAWKDASLFEAHEKSQQTTDFRSQLKSVHNSPYDQRVHGGLSIDSRPLEIAVDGICAVTHVDVPPTWRDQTVPLIQTLAEESRSHDGCIRYEVFQQIAPRTNHFTVFAVWKNRSAFDLHELNPYTRRFREAVGSMLGAPYDERLFSFLK